MSITLRCACGKRLQAADENAGKTARCPACGRAIVIPTDRSSPAAVPATTPTARPAAATDADIPPCGVCGAIDGYAQAVSIVRSWKLKQRWWLWPLLVFPGFIVFFYYGVVWLIAIRGRLYCQACGAPKDIRRKRRSRSARARARPGEAAGGGQTCPMCGEPGEPVAYLQYPRHVAYLVLSFLCDVFPGLFHWRMKKDARVCRRCGTSWEYVPNRRNMARMVHAAGTTFANGLGNVALCTACGKGFAMTRSRRTCPHCGGRSAFLLVNCRTCGAVSLPGPLAATLSYFFGPLAHAWCPKCKSVDAWRMFALVSLGGLMVVLFIPGVLFWVQAASQRRRFAEPFAEQAAELQKLRVVAR